MTLPWFLLPAFLKRTGRRRRFESVERLRAAVAEIVRESGPHPFPSGRRIQYRSH